MGVAGAEEHLRLVAGQIQAGDLAARNHNRWLGRLAFVAAREDGGIAAGFAQARRQMRHHGRFPDAAHGQSADADHRSFQGALRR